MSANEVGPTSCRGVFGRGASELCVWHIHIHIPLQPQGAVWIHSRHACFHTRRSKIPLQHLPIQAALQISSNTYPCKQHCRSPPKQIRIIQLCVSYLHEDVCWVSGSLRGAVSARTIPAANSARSTRAADDCDHPHVCQRVFVERRNEEARCQPGLVG